MSFKYPEKISHIPPPEFTRKVAMIVALMFTVVIMEFVNCRLRSKSQHSVSNQEYSSSSGGSNGSTGNGGYVDMIYADERPYKGAANANSNRKTSDYYSSDSNNESSGTGGGSQWVARERFMVQRNHSFMPPRNLGRGAVQYRPRAAYMRPGPGYDEAYPAAASTANFWSNGPFGGPAYYGGAAFRGGRGGGSGVGRGAGAGAGGGGAGHPLQQRRRQPLPPEFYYMDRWTNLAHEDER